MQQAPPVRVERLQQRRGEAAGRAEPGAGRDVGQRGDLDLRRPEPEHPDRLADDRVLHLVDRVDVLELRVLQDRCPARTAASP